MDFGESPVRQIDCRADSEEESQGLPDVDRRLLIEGSLVYNHSVQRQRRDGAGGCATTWTEENTSVNLEEAEQDEHERGQRIFNVDEATNRLCSLLAAVATGSTRRTDISDARATRASGKVATDLQLESPMHARLPLPVCRRIVSYAGYMCWRCCMVHERRQLPYCAQPDAGHCEECDVCGNCALCHEDECERCARCGGGGCMDLWYCDGGCGDSFHAMCHEPRQDREYLCYWARQGAGCEQCDNGVDCYDARRIEGLFCDSCWEEVKPIVASKRTKVDTHEKAEKAAVADREATIARIIA